MATTFLLIAALLALLGVEAKTLFGIEVDTRSVRAPFQEPPVIEDQEVELNLTAYTFFGPYGYTQKTRTYNGLPGGPTIMVDPGYQLRIKLSNQLAPEQNHFLSTVALHNRFRQPNTTNLHTHGLHVSSNPPGDNIFTMIQPGETYTLQHDIPDYHMGGTHWYHPHYHGSTNQQAGGGAAGVIIIKDPPNSLPAIVAEAEEKLLIINTPNTNYLHQAAVEYTSDCQSLGADKEDCSSPLWGDLAIPIANYTVVNGQTQPVMSIKPDEWYRFRLAYVGLDNFIMPAIPNCTIMLLAKDGVYMPVTPRNITRGYMGPGNRADWMVRCPAGVHVMHGGAGNDSELIASEGIDYSNIDDSDLLSPDDLVLNDILILNASLPSTVSGAPAYIPQFSVPRPCYLVDLFDQNPDKSFQAQFRFERDQAHNKFRISGNYFDDPLQFVEEFQAGTVNEINLTGISFHPFHIHINPVQLMDDPVQDASIENYFRKGDWHDVIFMPAGSASTKFQADNFTGKQIIHCHILHHEDQGMMIVTNIDGNEGAIYENATAVDPMCYRSAAELAALVEPVRFDVKGLARPLHIVKHLHALLYREFVQSFLAAEAGVPEERPSGPPTVGLLSVLLYVGLIAAGILVGALITFFVLRGIRGGGGQQGVQLQQF